MACIVTHTFTTIPCSKPPNFCWHFQADSVKSKGLSSYLEVMRGALKTGCSLLSSPAKTMFIILTQRYEFENSAKLAKDLLVLGFVFGIRTFQNHHNMIVGLGHPLIHLVHHQYMVPILLKLTIWISEILSQSKTDQGAYTSSSNKCILLRFGWWYTSISHRKSVVNQRRIFEEKHSFTCILKMWEIALSFRVRSILVCISFWDFISRFENKVPFLAMP